MTEPGSPHQELETSIRFTYGNEITVSRNVRQNVIVVPEDRVLLRAREFDHAIRTRYDINFPVGLLVGIVTAFVTSDFHDALGLPKEVWQASFLLAALLCLIPIIKSAYRFFTEPSPSPEQFVAQLRGSESAQSEDHSSELTSSATTLLPGQDKPPPSRPVSPTS